MNKKDIEWLEEIAKEVKEIAIRNSYDTININAYGNETKPFAALNCYKVLNDEECDLMHSTWL